MKLQTIVPTITGMSIFFAHPFFCMNPNQLTSATARSKAIVCRTNEHTIEHYSAHPEHINETLPEGQTPLTKTIVCNNYPLARWFVEHGADPNLGSCESMLTPLMLIAQKRHVKKKDLKFIRFLVLHQARIDAKNKAGETALMRAAQCTASPILIDFLLELGADPTIQNNLKNNTLYLGININCFSHMKKYFTTLDQQLTERQNARLKSLQNERLNFPTVLQLLIASYLSNDNPRKTKKKGQCRIKKIKQKKHIIIS